MGEFCDGVATEKWIMKGGYLRIEGESKEDVSEEQTSGNKEIKEVYDASGNKIDVKAQAALSDKDRKKKIKDLEKKLKDGKKKELLSDEEFWELPACSGYAFQLHAQSVCPVLSLEAWHDSGD